MLLVAEFYGDSITCGYGNLGNASCLGDAQWDLEDNSLTWSAFLGDFFDGMEHDTLSLHDNPLSEMVHSQRWLTGLSI